MLPTLTRQYLSAKFLFPFFMSNTSFLPPPDDFQKIIDFTSADNCAKGND